MKNQIILGVVLFVFAMGNTAFAQKQHKNTKDGIQWMTFEQAIKANEKEPKKIMIDLYTDWCGWCKKMDKTTFEHQEVAKFINEHYYAVKFDAEQREDVNYKGHTFKFVPNGRKGYNELAAALTGGKMSYPTIVFMVPVEDAAELTPIPVPGYRGPKEFYQLADFIAQEAYKDKTKTLEDFSKSHPVPFKD